MEYIISGFDDKEIELLVRISIVINNPIEKDKKIHVKQALFDKALLMDKSEFEDNNEHKVLNWYLTDEEIGSEKDYNLEEGKIYHVIVKPSIDNMGSYLVLDVIEYDIKDPIVLHNFNNDKELYMEKDITSNEEHEIMVLTKTYYKVEYTENGYDHYKVEIVCAVNHNTREILPSVHNLVWIDESHPNEEFFKHKFVLSPARIYNVKVKKSLTNPDDYELIDIIDKDTTDELLNKKRDEYIESLDQTIDGILYGYSPESERYEGCVELDNSFVDIYLMNSNLNDSFKIPEVQTKIIKNIVDNFQSWYDSTKKEIADSLFEQIKEIVDEDDLFEGELTKEMIYDGLSISYIEILDENTTVWFGESLSLGDVEVKLDTDGSIDSVNLLF